MGGQPLRQIGQFSLTLLLSAQAPWRIRARSACWQVSEHLLH
jgi:hypothetical protein